MQSDSKQDVNKEIFKQENLLKPAKRGAWKLMLPITVALMAIAYAGWYYGWNKEVVTGGVLLIGAASNAFAWVVGIIGLVPIVGPLIVKVLSLSVIWLLNAIGYLVAYVAIKRGYSKDVLTYRGLTIALIVGIVIGYILGSVF